MLDKELRMLDKVAYSKSSCFRFIFCKQLIKYSVSVIILKNSNYRRKNSHTTTICSWCPSHLILFILAMCRCFLYKALPSWKSNQLHWALLTFTFVWENLLAKKIFGKLVRYIFRPIVKIGPKEEKTTVIVKLPLWC